MTPRTTPARHIRRARQAKVRAGIEMTTRKSRRAPHMSGGRERLPARSGGQEWLPPLHPSIPVFDESPFIEFVLDAQEHLPSSVFGESLEEGEHHQDYQENPHFHGSLPIGQRERSGKRPNRPGGSHYRRERIFLETTFYNNRPSAVMANRGLPGGVVEATPGESPLLAALPARR